MTSIAPAASPAPRAVALWLVGCAAMVFVMVVLGGLTRLTDSGLSMMAWRPLSVLPPMSETEWQLWFDRYKQIPQYRNLFPELTMAGFKGIFWLEYLHRLWGRLIGLVFLLPLLFFWWRGAIGAGLGRRLAAIFVLGGLQGALGWFMVASGFSQAVAVSHYRLAAHLAAAVLIYGAILWVAFDLLWGRVPAAATAAIGLRSRLVGLLVLACATIVSGAFVAGLDAGMIYNSFPLMNGALLPSDAFSLEPWWTNFFDNSVMIQFTHRFMALVTVALVLWTWWASRRMTLPPRSRWAVVLVALAAVIQAGLGIATLLLVVPTALAAMHQAGALVLFTALLFAVHALGRG